MANEKRLIDANALWDKINNSTANSAVKALALAFVDTEPTVDTMDVIMCMDCKYWKYGMDYAVCRRIPGKEILPLRYNDFCSFGERKKR